MRFSAVSAALAFAASAIAQTPDFNPVYTPEKGEEVTAGSTFEVTWQAPPKYKDETVSISLIGGADPASLVPIADVVGGIQNSQESYQWTVDASLGAEATYGLVFKLESNPEIFQYSFPFKIAKGDGEEPEKPEEGGKPTHIVTTATGIKTVTLTSCPPTSTPIETSTFAPNSTTSTWSTSTKQWNTTTVVTTPLPPAPTTEVIPEPEPTIPAPPPSSTPSEVPEGAGATLVAGPVALIGGLAIALLI